MRPIWFATRSVITPPGSSSLRIERRETEGCIYWVPADYQGPCENSVGRSPLTCSAWCAGGVPSYLSSGRKIVLPRTKSVPLPEYGNYWKRRGGQKDATGIAVGVPASEEEVPMRSADLYIRRGSGGMTVDQLATPAIGPELHRWPSLGLKTQRQNYMVAVGQIERCQHGSGA
jgi:hypothetical protein